MRCWRGRSRGAVWIDKVESQWSRGAGPAGAVWLALVGVANRPYRKYEEEWKEM